MLHTLRRTHVVAMVVVHATFASLVLAGDPCEPHWDTSIGNPGLNQTGHAMVELDGSLYVGGPFSLAGGVEVNGVARWDGSEWHPVGTGLDGPAHAMAVVDGDLYVGGFFNHAGDVEAAFIAKWCSPTSTWVPLGDGVNNSVFAMFEFDGFLYVGGEFTEAGGEPAHKIARWDPATSTWSSLNSDDMSPGLVIALSVFDDGNGEALYVGGSFTSVGGLPVGGIARWDSVSGWSAMDTGVNGSVYAITVFDDGSGTGDSLFIGGLFDQASGAVANSLAKWDPQASQWIPLEGGVTLPGSSGDVSSLAVFNDGVGNSLFVGGFFNSAGGEAANNIARWDGLQWSGLGEGVDLVAPRFAPVSSAVGFGDGQGSALIVTGSFFTASGEPANNIAAWRACSLEESNTPIGDSVEVTQTTDDGATVTIIYDDVTSPGDTTVTATEPGDGQGPPVGFRLGNPPVIYHVETTAEFTGPITICFTWEEGQFNNENSLELMHCTDTPPCQTVTTSRDLENRIICGEVDGFSFFAIVEPVDPPFAICSAHPTDDPDNVGSAITVASSVPAEITLDGSSTFDPENFDLEFQWNAVEGITLTADPENPAIATGMFPLGTTTAVLTVTNEFGAVATCQVIITVEAAAGTATFFVTANTGLLWPPNHTMRDVQVIVTAIDFLEDPFEVFPVQVLASSSEPDNAQGNGDGNTTGDTNGEDGYTDAVDITDLFVWNPNFFSVGDGAWVATIQLRAERAGGGDGRVYTIELEALDLYNLNLGVSSIPIVVPRGMGGGGGN